ncbi:hypothetical protein SDC9_131337 [bioreactor metagenome]|uniref:Uncharacterized protein n=1 Tax=bioreactor metagenome TaxID=1076179 RepID=A0A645D4G3_9ZZZZ
MNSLLPILLTFFSSIVLSILACITILMELISSRNMVPPLAISNNPALSSAPVNEPFVAPNIILSKSVSGIAAQFCETKGFEALGPEL